MSVRYSERAEYTFPVVYGGTSGTPQVDVPAATGDLIKVTCNFMARASVQNGGFYYAIEPASRSDARRETSRRESVAQGNVWSSHTRVDFFRASTSGEIAFQVMFSKNDLNNPGHAGAFILIGENLGP